jgi:flagellar hook-associated protein 1 FlgK
MGGLLNALNSGKTSLSTNQKAIEIAGNNIANVNTPGYSRQSAVLTPYPALNFGDFFIGQGVKISNVQRDHDVFISAQILNKNRTLGEESARSTPLNQLERIFSVGENSLATEIDRFFDAWQELTANPSGQVERDIVLQRGDLLARSFQSAVGEFDAAAKDLNSTLVSKIDAVNFKLSEVADLNERIAAVETTGQSANTFRDRRDLLLQELSHSLGVQSYEENTGMVSIQLPGGLPLVQGNTALKLEGVQDGTGLRLTLKQGATVLDVTGNNLGGEFRGLVDVRDQLIPSLRDDLDLMAHTLATKVNEAHRAGVGLDGVGGLDFFTEPTAVGGAASGLGVALTSGRQVAAGAPANGGAPGDNTNAKLIAALGGDQLVNGEDTLVGFYGKITARVGIEAAQNRLSLGGAEDAVLQLQNLRDGKVGVSLEEEMINLIQFQKGFEASAKFLATVDEMMDTILSLKR